MDIYCKQLLADLEKQLNFISEESDDLIKRAELSVGVCQRVIAKLRNFILKYKFKDESEEIHFFKEVKPLFCGKLYYFISVYDIESRKPQDSGYKVSKEYLENEVERLRHYFREHIDIYKYYRTESTYLDHKYFVRGIPDVKISVTSHYFGTDLQFSTSHDFQIAMIRANSTIHIYLQEQLKELEQNEVIGISQDTPKIRLQWTESKVALVELLYALHSQGVFNNGKAELKDIADFLEKHFEIELGQYYRTFLEVRARKNGRTKFLDSLKESLLKKMDGADDPLE